MKILISSQLKFIPDAAKNETILPIDLETFDDEYIYWYYNLTCHSKLDTAFFSIELDKNSAELMKKESA